MGGGAILTEAQLSRKVLLQSRPKIGGDSGTPETPETPSSTGLMLDIVVTCQLSKAKRSEQAFS